MQAFRIETTVTKDRALQLTDLPFDPGVEVDVIISPRHNGAVHASEDSLFIKEWAAVSQPSLREIWDNDEDAAYDQI